MFIRGPWVHTRAPWGSCGLLGVVGVTCAPWVSCGSFGVVGFARVRPGVSGFILDSWVHAGAPWSRLGLLGSRGSVLRFVKFVRGRWVHSGASRGSSGLFGVFGFTRVRVGVVGFVTFTLVRPGGRRGSLGSRGCALEVYLGCLVSRCCSLAFVGFIRGRWVDWGEPLHRLVHSGSLGLLGCALGPSGSFPVVGFTRVHPVGRRVHSGSFGSLGCALRVVGGTLDSRP